MNVLIAGDFCPKDRVEQLISSNNTCHILEQVKNVISKADYSVLNFECPVINDNCKPISKKGPNLGCHREAIQIVKEAGFDCATLANNHFRDFGDEGCLNTISGLDDAYIDYVGGGRNLADAQRVLYREIQGVKVAFVNFCEHEFSIASETQAGSAPLDLIDNFKYITEARNNADVILVIVHGGHEFFQLPSPRMKKTYHWFVEIGADAVINHHQHCYSGYEVYSGKPIFYGLGNFCFDWNGRRKSTWNEGCMVALSIEQNKIISFELIPYVQCDEEPVVRPMDDNERQGFDKRLCELNEIIADDSMLEKEVSGYYAQEAKNCEIMLGNGSDNRIIRGLKRKAVIPSRASELKKNILNDLIFCESHRDKIGYWLTKGK